MGCSRGFGVGAGDAEVVGSERGQRVGRCGFGDRVRGRDVRVVSRGKSRDAAVSLPQPVLSAGRRPLCVRVWRRERVERRAGRRALPPALAVIRR